MVTVLRRRLDNNIQNIAYWSQHWEILHNDGVIEVLDRNGEVIARAGEEVCMGGLIASDWVTPNEPTILRSGDLYWGGFPL